MEHSQANISTTLVPPLTPAGLSLAPCLLQLFWEFLQTSLLGFLTAPNDTLLIFSPPLFSQESYCSSLPMRWFIGTAKVLMRANLRNFEKPYQHVQTFFLFFLTQFWVFHLYLFNSLYLFFFFWMKGNDLPCVGSNLKLSQTEVAEKKLSHLFAILGVQVHCFHIQAQPHSLPCDKKKHVQKVEPVFFLLLLRLPTWCLCPCA